MAQCVGPTVGVRVGCGAWCYAVVGGHVSKKKGCGGSGMGPHSTCSASFFTGEGVQVLDHFSGFSNVKCGCELRDHHCDGHDVYSLASKI